MEKRERFAHIMAALGEVFGKEMTTTQLELYYEVLDDVPIERIEENAYKHIRNGIFFPKPIELRTEAGITRPSYHQIYTPPWRGEERWKALTEGSDASEQQVVDTKRDGNDTNSEGGKT